MAESSECNRNAVACGGGLDYAEWTGAMLAGPGNTLWGVRVSYQEGAKFLDRWEIYEIAKAGPYAADGSFAQMEAGPLTVTWARLRDNEMVGEVSVRQDGTAVRVEAYPAHHFEGSGLEISPDDPAFAAYVGPCRFRLGSDGAIVGRSPHVVTVAGLTNITGGNAIITGRRQEILDESQGVDHFRLEILPSPGVTPLDCPSSEASEPGTESLRAGRDFRLGKGDRLTLRARVSASPIAPAGATDQKATLSVVEQAAKQHQSTRLWGEGPLGKAIEATYQELLWMSTWHPFEKKVFLPPGRAWMRGGGYNLWGWDENFNAVLAAVVNGNLAAANVWMALGCERLGPYAVWAVYQRQGDAALLRDCYPTYRKIYPPGNATLVRGNSRGGDKNWSVGKGMDDTPMREHGRHMGELFSLDASCMKAWSLEALAWMATALGEEADAAQYRRDHQVMVATLNLVFWNPEHGTYRNRYFSGEWAVTESPTSFYPWLACAPSAQQSDRLAKTLLNPDKFWGPYVIPSLAKDDPEYGKPSFEEHAGRIFPPYSYWRGAVWAPPNFLTYEGLKRYELDEIAAELAAKSVDLWWGNWTAHGWSSENYDPRTGERSKMWSHKHQSWSMLLPLLGLKELIDVEWWDAAEAIRFGSMSNEGSAVRNCRVRGRSCDVSIGEGRTQMRRDDGVTFLAVGGPCVVRGFRAHERECSFRVKSGQALRIELTLTGAEPVTLDVPAGYHRVAIEAGRASVTPYQR
ncbi:MAG: hypothetical protein WC869_13390 [Phycisphaerae bacterium]|jgi:hypothetical protein